MSYRVAYELSYDTLLIVYHITYHETCQLSCNISLIILTCQSSCDLSFIILTCQSSCNISFIILTCQSSCNLSVITRQASGVSRRTPARQTAPAMALSAPRTRKRQVAFVQRARARVCAGGLVIHTVGETVALCRRTSGCVRGNMLM